MEYNHREWNTFKEETEDNFQKVSAGLSELAEVIKSTQHQLTRIALGLEQSILQRQEISKSLKELQEGFSRFMDSMCYSLVDRAMKSLPAVLKDKYGIVVTSPLLRKFVKYSGKEHEVNIYGTGYMGDKELFIVGEAKPQLTQATIDHFLELVKYIETFNRTAEERFVFIITCSACPEVTEYAKKKAIEIIWSYEV
jgi:hypothetical protein